MGRPTKKTPERVDAILADLERGATIRSACAAAGVGETTLATWRASDPELAERMEQATSRCAVRMESALADAADTDWRAALAWLERRRPAEWGLRQSRDLDARIGELLAHLAGPR